MTKALIYCRLVPGDGEGATLDVQEEALIQEANRRGFSYQVVREESAGGSVAGNDKLVEVLDLLDAHKADVLMAVRIDHLTPDVGDTASILRRSKKRGWGIVLSGDKLDTSTDLELRAYLDHLFAKRERELISVRTREGMARRKAEGAVFGRPVDPGFIATYREVLVMVARGESYNSIARTLNDQNIATARGGKWYASTIKAIVESETAKRIGRRRAG